MWLNRQEHDRMLLRMGALNDELLDVKAQLLQSPHLGSKLIRAQHAKLMAEMGFEVLAYDDASGIFTFSDKPDPYIMANKD